MDLDEEVLDAALVDDALEEESLEAGAVSEVELEGALFGDAEVGDVLGDGGGDLVRGGPVVLVAAVVAVEEDVLDALGDLRHVGVGRDGVQREAPAPEEVRGQPGREPVHREGRRSRRCAREEGEP